MVEVILKDNAWNQIMTSNYRIFYCIIVTAFARIAIDQMVTVMKLKTIDRIAISALESFVLIAWQIAVIM